MSPTPKTQFFVDQLKKELLAQDAGFIISASASTGSDGQPQDNVFATLARARAIMKEGSMSMRELYTIMRLLDSDEGAATTELCCTDPPPGYNTASILFGEAEELYGPLFSTCCVPVNTDFEQGIHPVVLEKVIFKYTCKVMATYMFLFPNSDVKLVFDRCRESWENLTVDSKFIHYKKEWDTLSDDDREYFEKMCDDDTDSYNWNQKYD